MGGQRGYMSRGNKVGLEGKKFNKTPLSPNYVAYKPVYVIERLKTLPLSSTVHLAVLFEPTI